MKIGIILNTTYLIQNHLRYYDFLVEKYGIESLYIISTNQLSDRAANDIPIIDNIDHLASIKSIILTPDNFIYFLENGLNKFDFIVTQTSNFGLQFLMLFKYANQHGVKILDIGVGGDLISQYRQKDSVFKKICSLAKKCRYQGFRSLIRIVMKNDFGLLKYYLVASSSYGCRFLTKQIPEEYRVTKHFVVFREFIDHLASFGCKKEDITVIGPYFRKFDNTEQHGKPYVLYIDSNMVTPLVDLEFVSALQNYYKSRGFDFLYAPHPAMPKDLHDAYASKIDHMLDKGSATSYIDNADFVVTFGTTLAHPVLLKQKRTVFIYNEKIKKRYPELFEIQDNISRLSNVPNLNMDTADLESNKSINPDHYKEADVDKFLEEYYGSTDIVDLDPQQTIIDFIESKKHG